MKLQAILPLAESKKNTIINIGKVTTVSQSSARHKYVT